MEKKVITEEMGLHKEWFKDAKKQTAETLPEFIRHLTEDYRHDYGTICHAVGAAGLAAMWAVNNSRAGGITGFQAGFCMWDIIRQWMYPNNKCGLKIINFDDLLYPNFEYKHNTISKDILKNVQNEAQNRIMTLEKEHRDWEDIHSAWEIELEKFKTEVVEWQKLHPEYPTYTNNPKFYQRLGCGTAKQWDEEREKEAKGFMFAPREPYEPSVHPEVLTHWKMLAAGAVPFGLKVED